MPQATNFCLKATCRTMLYESFEEPGTKDFREKIFETPADSSRRADLYVLKIHNSDLFEALC